MIKEVWNSVKVAAICKDMYKEIPEIHTFLVSDFCVLNVSYYKSTAYTNADIDLKNVTNSRVPSPWTERSL